jgi:hypothetical protein
MGCADGAASVQPKKDETTPPEVETSLSTCNIVNLSNIYLAWGWNLCSLQLESGETLRTYREFDMTSHENHDLHCIDESFAASTSCVDGTSCCFRAPTPSAVEG